MPRSDAVGAAAKAGPLILSFDTSGKHIAAALARGDRVLAQAFHPMDRGQAERLMPVLDTVLAEADTDWAQLDALACGVGPGNFTGIRISVAAARGLALALGRPAHGVSSFDLMRDGVEVRTRYSLISLEAPRGRCYLALYDKDDLAGAPWLAEVDAVARDRIPADPAQITVVGSQAGTIAARLGLMAVEAGLDDLPARLARIARRRHAATTAPAPPAPLYVRPPDAALPAEPLPRILDDA